MANTKKLTRSRLINTIDDIIENSSNDEFINEIDKIAYETLFTKTDALWMRAERLNKLILLHYNDDSLIHDDDCEREIIESIFDEKVGYSWRDCVE